MLNKIPKEQWHKSMRGAFSGSLYNYMIDYPAIVCLTGDLGFGVFDKIKEDFPDRFYNVGAAEFSGLGIACGLAMTGKIPFFYSITTFLLYRGFEMLRNYVGHDKIPVRLIGSGRNKDYAHDGFSHDASDALTVLKALPNIKQYWPLDIKGMENSLKDMIDNDSPCFLSLKR